MPCISAENYKHWTLWVLIYEYGLFPKIPKSSRYLCLQIIFGMFYKLEKKIIKKKNLLEYIISSSPTYAKLGFELKGFFSLYRDVSRDVEITELMLDTGKSRNQQRQRAPVLWLGCFPHFRVCFLDATAAGVQVCGELLAQVFTLTASGP